MSDLYQHQELALRKLANGKVLWGGTGTGKSKVAAEYYRLREAPRDVYVITTARKRDSFDWQNEFYELGIGPASGPSVDFRGSHLAVQQRADNAAVCEVAHDAGGGTADRHPEDSRRVRPGSLGSGDGVSNVSTKSTIAGNREPIGRGTDQVLQLVSAAVSGSAAVKSSVGLQSSLADRRGLHSSDDKSTRRDSLGAAGTYPWVLTVDSWNNIAKYADVAGAFFIFDEQRLVGSGDWVRKFLRIAKHNHWILLSATPGDTWMDYVPIFIANGFYKNRTEFKREHVVYNTFTKFPKVDRYINQGRLARQRSQVLVEMPMERHTRRRHVEVMLDYDKTLLEKVLKDRWHVYEDRPLNDVAEMFLVGRRVVNSDPSRLEMVKELWKNHPRLIVFYNFNYELASLRSLVEHYGINSTTASADGLVTPSKALSIPPTKNGVISKSPSETTSLNTTTKSSRTLSASFPSTDARTARSAGISTTTLQPNMTLPALDVRSGSQKVGRNSSSLPTLRDGDSCTTSTLSSSDASSMISTTDGPLALSERPSSLSVSSKAVRLAEGVGRSTTSPINILPSVCPANVAVVAPANLEVSSTTTSIAEWNGHKHQPVPSGEQWIYLVQYTAGAEAWNNTDTDAMILHSQNYSWKTMEQAYGRIDRLNTPFRDLWYYGFTSNSFVDQAIARALKAKGTFNAAKYSSMFRG